MKKRSGSNNEFRALVRHEPRWRNMLASLRVLLFVRAPRAGGWVRFFDPHPMRMWRPQRNRTLATSVLVHFSVIFFLVTMPWALIFGRPSRVPLPLFTPNYQIFYPLPPDKVEIHAQPRAADKGRTAVAKDAPSPDADRAAGAGVKKPSPAPRFTLMLKPPHADNREQTIIQPNTPPDLRIKHYVPLPNVLLSGVATHEDPKMPTTGSAPKAVQNRDPSQAAMNVSAPVIPEMALAVQVPSDKQPILAAPEVALPMPAAKQALGSIYAAARADASGQKGRGLLVLGANPTPPGSAINLPPGNRYGEFSVSLLGGPAGVPSGPGGPAMGAGGKAGSGAGKSANNGEGGGGNAKSGGAGGGTGTSSVAALGPASNGTGGEGILPPWEVKDLVYPVARAANVPKINLIVTSGGSGGGGLKAYGILTCSKIYTIYLAMPGKPWVLQYCRQRTSAVATPAVAQTSDSIHFGVDLTPPWALVQYDFRRPPIAPYKQSQTIMLQGVITKEGAVENVKVSQGIGSIADQAALAAFRKWKFHPAQDPDGKPVAVDILVGIPAEPK